MSERKVLNKYFPPDFDPSKIPRRRLPKDQQHKVRLMTPFSMRCNQCGEYVYKGKKFNARKERVEGEDYLGIQIFRFYIKCPRCSGEITFKTDPKEADYVAEHGAQRNFEPWRDDAAVVEDRKAEKEKSEENNPMRALENRTLDSKREMDILDALDEIRMRNARNERVDSDTVLEQLIVTGADEIERARLAQEQEDDILAKSIFKDLDGKHVRRLPDEPDADVGKRIIQEKLKDEGGFLKKGSKRSSSALSLGVIVKRKKEKK
ncbi:CWC16 protein [Phlyctochytrium arcticum]|nr:CWC16 protein [Phlyctochytrium arcticum]